MTVWPLYRLLTFAAAPLLPFYLRRRMRKGKEDFVRFGERFGHASRSRPPGPLLWVHAASVGETMSMLPLLAYMLKQRPEWSVLVTTGTVTSARLAETRLAQSFRDSHVFHHYAPVDTPQAVKRFMDHWQADAALWLESEFWPNLLLGARRRGLRPFLINARISDRSFQGWRRFPRSVRVLLDCFGDFYAQSIADAQRLEALAGRAAHVPGNLKYDAPPLPADEKELASLHSALGARPAWIAASTHPGEEELLVRVHRTLRAEFPDALLILVPRHAARGDGIAKALSRGGWRVAQRSGGGPLAQADIYLADTMGELGLFYRLDAPVFIGGSFVPHGGQNVLEPARLGRPVLTGPHTGNFRSIVSDMKASGALEQVDNEPALASALSFLLKSPSLRAERGGQARRFVDARSGVIGRLTDALLPLLDQAVSHARP